MCPLHFLLFRLSGEQSNGFFTCWKLGMKKTITKFEHWSLRWQQVIQPLLYYDIDNNLFNLNKSSFKHHYRMNWAQKEVLNKRNINKFKIREASMKEQLLVEAWFIVLDIELRLYPGHSNHKTHKPCSKKQWTRRYTYKKMGNKMSIRQKA